MKILGLVFSVIIFALSATIVSAQNDIKTSLRISPVLIKLRLSPGTMNTYTIKVENLSDSPIPVQVSAEGFDSNDEEYGFKPTEMPSTTPLAEWIKIKEPESIIAARAIKEFEVTIQIPPTVEIGSYYAVIFFTPLTTSNAGQNTVNSRIGVVTLANIGMDQESNNEAEIITFDFNRPLFTSDNRFQTIIRVKNKSIQYFSVKPTLTFRSIFDVYQQVEYEEKTILPGKVRRWDKTTELALPIGLYTVQLKASLEGGNSVTKNTWLVVLPTPGMLVFSIGMLLSIFVLIFRKRIAMFIKILFKG